MWREWEISHSHSGVRSDLVLQVAAHQLCAPSAGSKPAFSDVSTHKSLFAVVLLSWQVWEMLRETLLPALWVTLSSQGAQSQCSAILGMWTHSAAGPHVPWAGAHLSTHIVYQLLWAEDLCKSLMCDWSSCPRFMGVLECEGSLPPFQNSISLCSAGLYSSGCLSQGTSRMGSPAAS